MGATHLSGFCAIAVKKVKLWSTTFKINLKPDSFIKLISILQVCYLIKSSSSVCLPGNLWPDEAL